MSNGKSSVLLVDDDHDVVWGMGRCLTRAGFQVATCSDGAEAISLLDSRPFDVLITDIRMPLVSGLALTDWVRKHQPQTKVIVMTAFGSTAMRQLSLRKGAFQYLEKPVDPEVLVEIISDVKRRGRFSGSIDDIDILDYMQLVLLAAKEAIIEVVARDGARGLIYVQAGTIRHATCNNLSGEEAFYECLGFDGGSFSNLPWHEPDEITIEKPGDFLLMEACRKRDEKRSGNLNGLD
jgi:CheY-like chemotaxis protein